MIANIIMKDDGTPMTQDGKSLTQSAYNPNEEVKKLLYQIMTDYQTAYSLQNRAFNEFDGISLLQRTMLDQQTFGAFVGVVWEPTQQSWRWQGRKNTARNKIIGILAHVISGMLYPFVYAYNEENKEDELTATVMRLLIENHLKKADYEMKFLFAMCSALVNPAVFMSVEYVQATQKVKMKDEYGKWRIEEVVDELLTGININIIPIDSILLGDFFVSDIQMQPFICRVRRIPYDQARAIYKGKYMVDGVDQFDYVKAGATKIVLAGQDGQTLYDIDWTLGDNMFVQEITLYYKSEDLEVVTVGGVFMGNSTDVYNSNPFKHRRTSVKGEKYYTIPVYPFTKSGFEPLDPNGRFAYYKSAAFKEYWDDASQNRMYQLAQDGTYLDVFKPIFLSGVSSIDSNAMTPGATIGMPTGASVTPYQLGPNLQGALEMMRVNQEDMSLSTQDALQSGIAAPGVTATASLKAEQNAKVIMNVFSTMIADLVRQLGALVMDDILLHTTRGEFDATIPESLKIKYEPVRVRSKENGKDMNNVIEFTTDLMSMSKKDAEELEWKMYTDNGGENTKTFQYKVNPYKFAKCQFSCYVDPQQIISRSMGTDQMRKERAFQMLMDPRVQPYIKVPEVVDKFILQEYSDGDPDQFKKSPEELQQAMFSMQGTPGQGPMPQPNQPQIAPGIPG